MVIDLTGKEEKLSNAITRYRDLDKLKRIDDPKDKVFFKHFKDHVQKAEKDLRRVRKEIGEGSFGAV